MRMEGELSGSGIVRIDLSPSDYVYVPQAPRIERRPIFARDAENEWEMWGVVGVGHKIGRASCRERV